MGRGSDEDISKGHKILEQIKRLISDASQCDVDKEFYLTRFVYQRLRIKELDNRKLREKLFKKDGSCNFCKSKFSTIKDVVLHRIKEDKGYVDDNCVLACGVCHKQQHARTNSGHA